MAETHNQDGQTPDRRAKQKGTSHHHTFGNTLFTIDRRSISELQERKATVIARLAYIDDNIKSFMETNKEYAHSAMMKLKDIEKVEKLLQDPKNCCDPYETERASKSIDRLKAEKEAFIKAQQINQETIRKLEERKLHYQNELASLENSIIFASLRNQPGRLTPYQVTVRTTDQSEAQQIPASNGEQNYYSAEGLSSSR